jgi:hypothetical protein
LLLIGIGGGTAPASAVCNAVFLGGGGGADFFCAAANTRFVATGDTGLAEVPAFIRANRCCNSFTCEAPVVGRPAVPPVVVSIPNAGTEMPARARFDAAC